MIKFVVKSDGTRYPIDKPTFPGFAEDENGNKIEEPAIIDDDEE